MTTAASSETTPGPRHYSNYDSTGSPLLRLPSLHHQQFATAGSRLSRGSSPDFDSGDDELMGLDDYDYDIGDDADDEILAQAIRTRLPASMSPGKEFSPDPLLMFPHPDTTMGTNFPFPQTPQPTFKKKELPPVDEKPEADLHESSDNYIRFAMRAEVQQRTEPIDATLNFLRTYFLSMTSSWTHVACSLLVAILSIAAMRSLFHPASLRSVPDLVKVAGIARSFEPLIYYSENGVAQVSDLQATGVAVWDLSESVRLSNLTSAPIIVKELDDLSETLKTLAIELTKFFANVDGDIDGILIVMDWAKRELAQVQQPAPPLTAAFDNLHNFLSSTGLLENTATGTPTRIGSVATALFGMSSPQRTHTALRRTFNEFLSVLEEAVTTELQHSLALFALFEAVDRQFLNLARTVAREASVQDEQHADLLASLWTRILGANAAQVKKYEQNRELLRNVREKTVRNKGILMEHNHRLLALKASLESLRRKLVSPLVRSVNSSTLSLEEQIRGLEDVGGYLEGVRARQKGKLMEMLYGAGRYNGIGGGSDVGTVQRDPSRMIDDAH